MVLLIKLETKLKIYCLSKSNHVISYHVNKWKNWHAIITSIIVPLVSTAGAFLPQMPYFHIFFFKKNLFPVKPNLCFFVKCKAYPDAHLNVLNAEV